LLAHCPIVIYFLLSWRLIQAGEWNRPMDTAAAHCDHLYPRAFSAGQKVVASHKKLLTYSQLLVHARRVALAFISRLDKEQGPTEREAFCLKVGYMRSFLRGAYSLAG
jgi:hypothetical protein